MTDTPESDLELQRALGRLEAAVAALTVEVRAANAMHAAHDASIDSRVAVLEKWRIYLIAFAAGISAATSTIFVLVWRVLSLAK